MLVNRDKTAVSIGTKDECTTYEISKYALLKASSFLYFIHSVESVLYNFMGCNRFLVAKALFLFYA